jgi:hypothetical protein
VTAGLSPRAPAGTYWLFAKETGTVFYWLNLALYTPCAPSWRSPLCVWRGGRMRLVPDERPDDRTVRLVRAAQRGDTLAMAELLDLLASYVGRVCAPIAWTRARAPRRKPWWRSSSRCAPSKTRLPCTAGSVRSPCGKRSVPRTAPPAPSRPISARSRPTVTPNSPRTSETYRTGSPPSIVRC